MTEVDAATGSTKPGYESPPPPLGLFEGFGVELELMIVDADTLDVRPVADRLMEAVAGEPVSELELGPLAWSNELALHVLEIKTNGPSRRLEGLAGLFRREVERANGALEGMGCRLLPGGMHPWMDPLRETRLWPHEYTEVYQAFDRIFSCRGHGWSNLQSTHLNLPFRDDREFGALHAAVRVVLPLLPALTAASPIVEGRVAGHLDERLAVYRTNAARIPSVSGQVIPEPAGSRDAYEARILRRIYRDLEPLDPEGTLRHEWVNARGAIARFQRGSVEIRLMDSQEAPGADLAVSALVAGVVQGLCERALDDPSSLDRLETARLAGTLDDVVRDGEEAIIRDPDHLAVLGLPGRPRRLEAGEVWKALAADARTPSASGTAGAGAPRLFDVEEWSPFLRTVLDHGPLARRILRAVGPAPDRPRILEVYRELADCLGRNRPFFPTEGLG